MKSSAEIERLLMEKPKSPVERRAGPKGEPARQLAIMLFVKLDVSLLTSAATR
jgi:hypothetical protein